MEEVFSYKSLVHALSGMAGGMTAITVFFPLNSIRTRLQVSESKEKRSLLEAGKKIVSEEGPLALYRGLRSTIVSLGCSNFVYFYTYNGLKAAVSSYLRKSGGSGELQSHQHLILSSVAGVVNVLSTTPLWTCGTRLTVQTRKQIAGKDSGPRPYKGTWDALTRIIQEEGVLALWNGTIPSLILVSNPVIQFVVYERLRKIAAGRAAARGTPINSLEFFVVGACAKAVATVCTYPLQLAQSRLRAMRKKASKDGSSQYQYTGTVDILQKVRQAEGFRGWFRGMEAKLWQTVLTAAFMFLTYEQIARLVFSILLRKQSVGKK